LDNCILWDAGDEFRNNDGSTIAITYSDVQGGWQGTGNINTDPIFVDTDGRLSVGSPCIDAGDNGAVPAWITTDLEGNPRIADGDGDGDPKVDMGAYEGAWIIIDIKPGSDPNSINLGSHGGVPVAIFSTDEFDASTVDPVSITLAGATVRVKGKGTPMASLEDVDSDGLLDLVVHVETEALDLTEGDVEAVLEGMTFDGMMILGTDSIRVVP
jgi:hypothetical protein